MCADRTEDCLVMRVLAIVRQGAISALIFVVLCFTSLNTQSEAADADSIVRSINLTYGAVCNASLEKGWFSKTLKIDWTGSTTRLHAIKIFADVANVKSQLYEAGVRYFKFPNDAGDYNIVDWKTGEKTSVSERALYHFGPTSTPSLGAPGQGQANSLPPPSPTPAASAAPSAAGDKFFSGIGTIVQVARYAPDYVLLVNVSAASVEAGKPEAPVRAEVYYVEYSSSEQLPIVEGTKIDFSGSLVGTKSYTSVSGKTIQSKHVRVCNISSITPQNSSITVLRVYHWPSRCP